MTTPQDLLESVKNEEIINLTELLYDKEKGEFKYDRESELEINNFPNLKEIRIEKVKGDYIEYSNITKMTIANCPNLTKVDINTFVDNKELVIKKCPNLKEIDCSYNDLNE